MLARRLLNRRAYVTGQAGKAGCPYAEWGGTAMIHGMGRLKPVDFETLKAVVSIVDVLLKVKKRTACRAGLRRKSLGSRDPNRSCTFAAFVQRERAQLSGFTGYMVSSIFRLRFYSR